MDRQSRAEKESQLAASRELWAAIDNGGSLEDVPVATRVTAGSATIADATDYMRNRESGKIIQYLIYSPGQALSPSQTTRNGTLVGGLGGGEGW